MNAQKFEEFKVEAEPHVKAILKSLVQKVVVPAVQEAVDKSETKIDDLIAKAVLGNAEQAALSAIDSLKL